ncbi:hypothetical protein CLV35_2113 [Motilibacter peucedani]|uniref:Exo-alpha-sialidase n=1 Tax=Motilibacter peucedani TaxID=598650 RepID=A0A420XQZ2_9ACTN|nr:hypothetical protein CLV35_2113 [Motilibacter peucedani]
MALYGACPASVQRCSVRLYGSRDGGATWSRPTTAATTQGFPSLVLSQDGRAAVLTWSRADKPLITTDGGTSWSVTRRVDAVEPSSVSTDHDILLGRGLSDGKGSALDVVDPAASTVATVSVARRFEVSSSGIAVRGSTLTASIDGAASVSTDAGATWRAAPRADGELGSAASRAPDGSLVRASGGDGAGWVPLRHLYRSSDDGRTWSTTRVARVPAVPMDTLVVTQDGYLASSTDGEPLRAGRDLRFTPLGAGVKGPLASLQAGAAGAWATTMDGRLLLVRASGAWKAVPLPE